MCQWEKKSWMGGGERESSQLLKSHPEGKLLAGESKRPGKKRTSSPTSGQDESRRGAADERLIQHVMKRSVRGPIAFKGEMEKITGMDHPF